MVEHLSDDELSKLRRGGHDYRKVYAAYKAATEHRGAPTVVLAKTVKGWTLGPGVEARNITHQAKKLNEAELRIFRDRLELPIPDATLKDAPYYHPGPDSEEAQYLRERRAALGGPLPKRVVRAAAVAAAGARGRRRVRCREHDAGIDHDGLRPDPAEPDPRSPQLGPRIVPIIPDEARTFGMDPLFKEVGIYAALGQRYEPVDSDLDPVLPRGDRRPGPRGGDHRGRLDGQLPGRRDVIRDARPEHDPVLHLLFDVRVPANRRPDVGARRRAGTRLPDGGDGRVGPR